MQNIVERVLAKEVEQTIVKVTSEEDVVQLVTIENSEGLLDELYSSHSHETKWFLTHTVLLLVRRILSLMFISSQFFGHYVNDQGTELMYNLGIRLLVISFGFGIFLLILIIEPIAVTTTAFTLIVRMVLAQ